MRFCTLFAAVVAVTAASAAASAAATKSRIPKPIPTVYEEHFGSHLATLRKGNDEVSHFATTPTRLRGNEIRAYHLKKCSKLGPIKGCEQARLAQYANEPSHELVYTSHFGHTYPVQFQVKDVTSSRVGFFDRPIFGSCVRPLIHPTTVKFKHFRCTLGNHGHKCKNTENGLVALKTKRHLDGRHIFRVYEHGNDVDELTTILLTTIAVGREEFFDVHFEHE